MNGSGGPGYVAVDTRVLRGANAPIDTRAPPARSTFAARRRLLECIVRGAFVVLVSPKLVKEYRDNVPEPLGDFVIAFLALLDLPSRRKWNWQRRWRGERDITRRCHFPPHDDHVLRTAIRPDGESTLYAEEPSMLSADRCIHRHFRVHILRPT